MATGATEADATLVGFTVGVTADRRWEDQANLLRRRGATVLHGPSIRTLPLGSIDELYEVTQRLIRKPPHIVVASTGIGVRTWLSAAESWGLEDALLQAIGPTRIFARNAKAAAAVQQAGLDIVSRIVSADLTELIESINSHNGAARLAFQSHGEEGTDHIKTLRRIGADVVEVPTYRWILPRDTKPAEQLIRAAIDRALHAITFTSAPSIRNLLIIAQEMECGAALLEALNTDVLVVTVGPVCESAARHLGIADPVTPEKWRISPMISTLSDALQATQQRTTVGGIPIALRGSTVFVDGEPVGLSRRETELFRALLRRSPGFVTKRDLHLRVWGGAGDDHVVEVTVGRLRRKLGLSGSGIVSIPRRGYAVRA